MNPVESNHRRRIFTPLFPLLVVLCSGACLFWPADTTLAQPASGQTNEYTSITLAGSTEGVTGAVDAIGTAARFYLSFGVAVDGAGNLYVADTGNSTIRKISLGGVVTTLAGQPGSHGSADGIGSAARFGYANDVAVDGEGNVFVADYGSHTIRKINPAGMVTTLAGLAGNNGSTDGTGSEARFAGPDGVAIDGSGTLFVADRANHIIRKIDPAGVVSTVAGLAGSSGSVDGAGSEARLYYPTRVCVDSAGNLYVSDSGNNTIRKISPGGIVTTLAGLAGSRGSADGAGSEARFSGSSGVAVDGADNVFVADYGNHTIRKIDPQGNVTTIVGLAGNYGSMDGTGGEARFGGPSGLAVDGAGILYVADGARICVVTAGCADRPTIDLATGPAGELRQLNVVPHTTTNCLWRVIRQPSTSRAKLSSTTVPNPTFIPDQPGLYMFQLRATNALRQISVRNLEFSAFLQLDIASHALNNTNLVWSTGWDKPWYVQNSVSQDGGSAAQSGAITNGQQSWIETTFLPSATGILQFHWKVSSENNQDLLKFYLNGIESASISGEFGWHEQAVDIIDTNRQTLRYVYAKDSIGYSGADAGWLDQVIFTEVPNSDPYIIEQPVSLPAVPGANVAFHVAASGFPSLNYQWLKDGTNLTNTSRLSGSASGTLLLLNVQASDAGRYFVVITNAFGSVTSQVAVLQMLNPIIVTIQPQSPMALATNIGANLSLSANVSGSSNLLWRWSHNGVAIQDATNSTLVLENLQATNSGNYSVTVTNATVYGIAYMTLLVGAESKAPQEFAFVTLAGSTRGYSGREDGTGIAARFYIPSGLAVDRTGTIYVADSGNATIRQIGPDAVVTTVAGLAWNGGIADGMGSAARFSNPTGVNTDKMGNLYVADTSNHTIRKIGPKKLVSTMAGWAGNYGNADGTGSAARFKYPSGVAVDSAGNAYVTDNQNHTIRKISPSGIVTTVAGLAGNYGNADGTGSTARFNYPSGVAVDSADNVYVSDWGNHTIRKIGPSGIVTTVAGVVGNAGSADGPGSVARFNNPCGVTVDGAGTVYVADYGNNTIRKIGTGGEVTTLGGLAGSAGIEEGIGSTARFSHPTAVAVDSAGNLYVADGGNNRICIAIATCADRPTIDLAIGPVGGLRQLDVQPQTATNWLWRQIQRPTGSTASLTATTLRNPAFIPDKTGLYTFQLRGTNALGEITIRNVEFTAFFPFDAIPQALNASNLLGTVGGDKAWFVQTKITHDGVSALQSGAVTGGQQSWLEAYFVPSGTGILRFQWKVSSAKNQDFLKFYLNGMESASISGELDWQQQEVDIITTNQQTLRWIYVKNNLYNTGSDAGWLDQVSFAEVPLNSPTIASQPGSLTLLAGTNVALRVAATGFPSLNYQWRKDGRNLVTTNRIAGAASDTLAITNLQSSDTGQYVVVITNALGSVTSQVAFLRVLNPIAVAIQPWSPPALVTNIGASVRLAVSVPGSEPFVCQWSKAGIEIQHATNSTLLLTNLAAADSGKYSVTVANLAEYGEAYLTLLVGTNFMTPLEYSFVTLAGPSEGGSASGSVDGKSVTARFNTPGGLAVDGAGNVYVADNGNHTIRKIDPDGVVATVAGLAGKYGSADGTGSVARFNHPAAVAMDSADNVYVADTYNHTIRKIGPGGAVTTLAGLAGIAGAVDGKDATARFNAPYGVAVDAVGNVYVSDSNHTIRKLSPAGVVTTVAGLAGYAGSADGVGSQARFSLPTGLAVDGAGNIYVADYRNSTIRKIGPGGLVTTIAGLAGNSGSLDGTGSQARFNYPCGVAVDTAGNVYVADTSNQTIRRISLEGVVATVGGMSWSNGNTDGTSGLARFYRPEGMAMDGLGNLYIADTWNNRICVATAACLDRPTIDLAVGAIRGLCQLDVFPQTATSWQWRFIQQPTKSTATLSSTTLHNPTFTPDLAGLYVIQLRATNATGQISIRNLEFTATLPKGVRIDTLRLVNGQAELTLLGTAGTHCQIQILPNLSGDSSWQNLAALPLTNNIQLWIDTASSGLTQRFYRAFSVP